MLLTSFLVLHCERQKFRFQFFMAATTRFCAEEISSTIFFDDVIQCCVTGCLCVVTLIGTVSFLRRIFAQSQQKINKHLKLVCIAILIVFLLQQFVSLFGKIACSLNLSITTRKIAGLTCLCLYSIACMLLLILFMIRLKQTFNNTPYAQSDACFNFMYISYILIIILGIVSFIFYRLNGNYSTQYHAISIIIASIAGIMYCLFALIILLVFIQSLHQITLKHANPKLIESRFTRMRSNSNSNNSNSNSSLQLDFNYNVNINANVNANENNNSNKDKHDIKQNIINKKNNTLYDEQKENLNPNKNEHNINDNKNNENQVTVATISRFHHRKTSIIELSPKQEKLLKISSKYTLLVGISVLSTFTSAIIWGIRSIYESGKNDDGTSKQRAGHILYLLFYFWINVDCLVNSFCLMFQFSVRDELFKKICAKCHWYFQRCFQTKTKRKMSIEFENNQQALKLTMNRSRFDSNNSHSDIGGVFKASHSNSMTVESDQSIQQYHNRSFTMASDVSE